MYASALPLAVSFYFLFAPPEFITQGAQSGMFFWMLTLTVITRLAMTLYHVPHLALGAELSTNYDERTSLVAIPGILCLRGYRLHRAKTAEIQAQLKIRAA